MSYEDLQALGDVAGTVSRGLAAHSIQTLPQASFKQLASARRRGSCGGEPPAAAAGATAAGEGEGAGAQLVATNLQRCTICLADFEEEGGLCPLSAGWGARSDGRADGAELAMLPTAPACQ